MFVAPFADIERLLLESFLFLRLKNFCKVTKIL